MFRSIRSGLVAALVAIMAVAASPPAARAVPAQVDVKPCAVVRTVTDSGRCDAVAAAPGRLSALFLMRHDTAHAVHLVALLAPANPFAGLALAAADPGRSGYNVAAGLYRSTSVAWRERHTRQCADTLRSSTVAPFLTCGSSILDTSTTERMRQATAGSLRMWTTLRHAPAIGQQAFPLRL